MERSHFDGPLLQLIGYRLLFLLITTATFGLGYPWAQCMMWRWEADHTSIETRRLQFTGTGSEFFKPWIILVSVPFLASVAVATTVYAVLKSEIRLTLAVVIIIMISIANFIYGFYANLEIKRWKIAHTELKVHLYIPGEAPRPKIDYITELYEDPNWAGKLTPFLPLIYLVWGVFVVTVEFYVLSLIFK